MKFLLTMTALFVSGSVFATNDCDYCPDAGGYSERFNSSTFGNITGSGGSSSENGGWAQNATAFTSNGWSGVKAGCTDCDLDIMNYGGFNFDGVSTSQTWGDGENSAGAGWGVEGGWDSDFSSRNWAEFGVEEVAAPAPPPA